MVRCTGSGRVAGATPGADARAIPPVRRRQPIDGRPSAAVSPRQPGPRSREVDALDGRRRRPRGRGSRVSCSPSPGVTGRPRRDRSPSGRVRGRRAPSRRRAGRLLGAAQHLAQRRHAVEQHAAVRLGVEGAGRFVQSRRAGSGMPTAVSVASRSATWSARRHPKGGESDRQASALVASATRATCSSGRAWLSTRHPPVSAGPARTAASDTTAGAPGPPRGTAATARRA